MKKKIKNILGRINYRIVIGFIKTKRVNYKSILIVAPHPDDEIIGLGGLILQTLKQKGEVHITYLSDGEGSGAFSNKEEIKKQRQFLTEQVIQNLKIKPENISRLHFLDGSVPHSGQKGFYETVGQINTLIETIKPEAVFATAESDYWPYDHVACAQIVKEAVETSNFKTNLWFYWVWTWYHLRPWQLLKLKYKNLVKLNISNELKGKQNLMDIYLKPKYPGGIPWSGTLPESMIYPFAKPYEIIENYERQRL